jgi:FixJ family two-component response regulator
MDENYDVFVIDDDPSAQRGIVRFLQKAGISVRGFCSGKEFLESVGPEIYGCLVLDAHLSDMPCEELIKEIKQKKMDFKIIFITGDDDPVTRRKAQKLDAVGFFNKPVDSTALLDTIRWVMNRKVDR